MIHVHGATLIIAFF